MTRGVREQSLRSRVAVTVATYALLCTAGGISFVLPEGVGVRTHDVAPLPAVHPTPEIVREDEPTPPTDDPSPLAAEPG